MIVFFIHEPHLVLDLPLSPLQSIYPMSTLHLPRPPKRSRITRAKLHAMGYSKGQSCYFKRRLCRWVRGFGYTTSVLIQVQPYNEGAGWERGKSFALFHVNSREYPIKGKGSPIEYHGAEHSEVDSVSQLRDWESFAFCP